MGYGGHIKSNPRVLYKNELIFLAFFAARITRIASIDVSENPKGSDPERRLMHQASAEPAESISFRSAGEYFLKVWIRPLWIFASLTNTKPAEDHLKQFLSVNFTGDLPNPHYGLA